MRIALGVEYDGTAFAGWQWQPGRRTVQEVLEGAVSCVADASTRVHCAGRTDAGVHALAQVVHFDTAAARTASTSLPSTTKAQILCATANRLNMSHGCRSAMSR